MIYIDPPYNTGNDLLYHNDFSDNLLTYLQLTNQIDEENKAYFTNTETDGRFHSNWLDMMYTRIYVSKNILKDDGIFVISIDHNELNHLISICNEIFGEENRLGIITVVHKPEGRNQAKFFGESNEFMLFYAKNKGNCNFRRVIIDEEKVEEFALSDEKGNYKLKNFIRLSDGKYSLRINKPDFYYPIYVSSDLKNLSTQEIPGYTPVYPITISDQERTWKTSKATCEERIQNGSIIAEMSDKRIVIYEKLREDQVIKTHWIDKKYHAYHFGTKVVDGLLNAKTFDFPKSVYLIIDTLKIVLDKDDIVIDYFAGSATTAHAIFELNKEDGGNRKFICIQLPEPTDINGEAFKAGYKTIADIGKERIRRVIKKIEEEQKENADMFTEDKSQLDLGFKVFKLLPSNFTTWNANVDKTADAISKQLELHITHISETADQEAILYELLLKSGFELTTKIEKLEIEGKAVFSIAEGELLVCLERKLTNELIKAMAERKPTRVICLDEGFQNNDQLKTNAALIMKSKGVVKFQTV